MTCYIGIDVQTVRCPCFAVLSDTGEMVDSGWVSKNPPEKLVALTKEWQSRSGKVVVAVDAPRMPLPSSRLWYWQGSSGRWRAASPSDVGRGRHCEVVISALGLATPQWTPVLANAPEWMRLGFEIFSSLAQAGPCVELQEVFPTASFNQLQGDRSTQIKIDFSAFAPGPRDLLDACIAAITAREFGDGRGAQIGGADGLGTIILPRPVTNPLYERVQAWPTQGSTV